MVNEFKINRNYENLIKTKKGKVKHTETIVDGEKGLYIKCVGIEKSDSKKEVTDLIKITVKEMLEKKKFSLRIKTLKAEDNFESLTKTELVKKLSEKKHSHITSHAVEYMKKDMISLRK